LLSQSHWQTRNDLLHLLGSGDVKKEKLPLHDPLGVLVDDGMPSNVDSNMLCCFLMPLRGILAFSTLKLLAISKFSNKLKNILQEKRSILLFW
jgi:hypothetical protein